MIDDSSSWTGTRFDDYKYHDSLQARLIEGIDRHLN